MMLQIVVLGVFGKLSTGTRGLHGLGWFHGVRTCGAKVHEHRIISSLKIQLNSIVAKNFGGIGMCLWCCWKDLDERDLMEFIWIQNVGDIDF
jgi:hypothetical protein